MKNKKVAKSYISNLLKTYKIFYQKPTKIFDIYNFFFHLYRKGDYFNIEQYSPQKYKEYIYSQIEICEGKFRETYSSAIYGFNESNIVRKKQYKKYD